MSKHTPPTPEDREAWKECCGESETVSVDSGVMLGMIEEIERLEAEVARLREAAAIKEEEQEEEPD